LLPNGASTILQFLRKIIGWSSFQSETHTVYCCLFPDYKMQLTDLWVIVTKDVFPNFNLPAQTVAQVQEMEEHLKEHSNLCDIFVSTKITIVWCYNTICFKYKLFS
jgi:hypothetical protein